MKNYDGMSDFEISYEIAKFEGFRVCNSQHYKPKVSYWNKDGHYTLFDVMSWEDIGPIIERELLDIEWPVKSLGGVGTITKYIDGGTDVQVDFSIDANPLRAAAIVYLMSKEK